MQTPKVYPYRWVVLIVFMFISFVIQLQWLAHAAVARPAAIFYAGQYDVNSFFNIDFLAMSYMLIYILVSIPASYIINKYGIRKSIVFGAVLSGISGLVKGVYADSFLIVLWAQIGFSIAQPFVLNAVTALSVRWFPLRERGLAGGLAILAQYIGIIVAMLYTPSLIGSDPNAADYGSGFKEMLMLYAWITLGVSILSILLIREKPKTPPADDDLVRQDFSMGMRHIFKLKDMRILLMVFLVGLGLFNAISSMTDAISDRMQINDSDGLVGGLMLIGGIIGAILIPPLSDKFRRRKIFIVICTMGAVPGVLGLALTSYFVQDTEIAYHIVLASSFILGFFIMSAGPIGFQYAAEISYPAPESISQGLLLWIGQISGLIFVAGMSYSHNKFLSHWMIAFCVMMIGVAIAVLWTKESPMIITERDRIKEPMKAKE